MSALKLAATALLSSAITAVITTWAMTAPAAKPLPTIPPLAFYEEQDELVIWGAWNTTLGYDDHATAATEIRCSKSRMSCVEGVGRLLIHDKGQDLEAETFGYQVEDWSETSVKTVATRLMADCLERRMKIDLTNRTAVVTWEPSHTCERGDTGKAILNGERPEDI
ncbi:hypothetical protein [Ectopseudomonas oleovorans]|uniref:hypothetical protein n=1 Tax=Ectopseudomonas oleovorans TaxID=301 RepID=UPI000E6AB39D|nr:hypothetical protein [Pseudomonas oleovorans]